jgi:hypothetical protein
MDGEKRATLAIVGILSKIIGVLAGAVMAAGRKIRVWMRNTLETKADQSAQFAEKPGPVRAKAEARPQRKKATRTRKRATTTRKRREGEAGVKRGTRRKR